MFLLISTVGYTLLKNAQMIATGNFRLFTISICMVRTRGCTSNYNISELLFLYYQYTYSIGASIYAFINLDYIIRD